MTQTLTNITVMLIKALTFCAHIPRSVFTLILSIFLRFTLKSKKNSYLCSQYCLLLFLELILFENCFVNSFFFYSKNSKILRVAFLLDLSVILRKIPIRIFVNTGPGVKSQ